MATKKMNIATAAGLYDCVAAAGAAVWAKAKPGARPTPSASA
jgi:hypothetical protein